ncbi:hypothetical protein BKI52_35800 [marine bacterium AO1-C]|nr:hypothetical protein BKI52_35800 [marine bacterium AO1-C]
MKSFSKILVIGFLTCVLNACYSGFDSNGGCLVGKGDITTEERTFESPIQNIYSNILGVVHIVQGNEEKVTIKAQPNIIARIKTTYVNNELRLEVQNQACLNNTQVDIYVTTPTIQRVTQSGQGEIRSEGVWKMADMELITHGSGQINAEVECTDLKVQINDYSKIVLKGKTQNQEIDISGYSEYQAYDLVSNNATVNLQGSGIVGVWASQQLNATIRGNGCVLYKGSPTITQNISGGGVIHPVDTN